MSDFPENLRLKLQDMGWKQKEAAQAFQVSQANISQWLSGVHEPSVEQIIKVARALEVSVDELLRAPGPALREQKASYGNAAQLQTWFRQLKTTWKYHPDERHRIKTAMELAWPNQCEQILKWFDER